MTHQDKNKPQTVRPVVLAVDDVADNLTTIAEMVRELDVDVRVASNGAAALRYALLEPRPDLILLDVMMPGMNGHEVLAELRANPETREIPVIFVTALDSQNDEEIGLLEGAVDYVTKPIKPNILKARVRAQLALKHGQNLLKGQKDWLEQEVSRRVSENAQLEAHLQLALSASGVGIWEHDHVTGVCTGNISLCDVFGLADMPSTIIGFLELAHPEDRQVLDAFLTDSLSKSDGSGLDSCRMRHSDGRWLWVEVRGRVVTRNSEGKAILSMGTMADVSQRINADIDQRLAALVFNGINDGICITNPNAQIVLTNPAFTKVTGYPANEAINQSPNILKSGVHGAAFYQNMWSAIRRHGSWQGEITNRRKDGELVSEWLSIFSVHDASGRLTNYVGLFSDLSERKVATDRINYLSSFDSLTDLPNRNLFADRLGQSLSNARRFSRQTAVILLDLDRFRFINDTLGPPIGDEVLIEVSRRLNLQVREGDTVGRRSGNEFGFVMANLSHEQDAIALAQRMLEAIAVPFVISDQSVVITASIGISVSPRNGDDTDGLLKCADAALLRAKKSGRNTFRFYSPEMDADAERRLGLERQLREALQRDELVVFYQPQISLDSGRMIGMEALLRWNSPVFGMVSPVEFIPVAEETGLILPIGEWVLRTACLQTRKWLDLGLANLRLAVNLSTRQFSQASLVNIVKQTLQETGLPAAALELEITESAFIDDLDQAIAQCRALKAIGVKLSLDDFGTGYSSLAYISRFPFDKIKIDQGFVRDIIENPVNAAIASAAILMARSLNVSVLAEGVETEAQASFLRGKRCDAMQGWLFSRALPAADFELLLVGNKSMPPPALETDNGQTLLLVDDEPNILASLSRLFRREGFKTITATSPAIAFELLAKHRVQVVLSDQRMPEMSGTEFLSRVRQLYPDTIRIVLTGYTDLDSVTGAINRGAIYKFLTKPWDDDLLREQVREAFRLVKDSQTRLDTSPTHNE